MIELIGVSSSVNVYIMYTHYSSFMMYVRQEICISFRFEFNKDKVASKT